MKYSTALAALVAIASAAPLDTIETRAASTVANDVLKDTTCKANYLIVARGSTEADNLVSLHPFLLFTLEKPKKKGGVILT